MMVRDEADILEASLRAATRWFDRILVLDGTTDLDARRRTDEILGRFPEVVHHVRDDDLPVTVVRDGARQYLLEEARRRYGHDRWIGILHADECLDQDPRPLLAARHPSLHPSVRVRLVHTFLHVEDEARWAELADRAVRSRIRHLMWPGVPEARFFFDAGDRDYDVGHHAKVVPRSLRNGPLVDGYVITQYNERSPAQVAARARQRAADGWQGSHYERFLAADPTVFTTSLDRPGAPFAPEFAGDPEGPFVATDLAAIVHGPDPALPPPRLLTDATTADHPDEPDALVDLAYVTAPGGLLDLTERRSVRNVVAWAREMRDLRPGHLGAAACGAGPPPQGYTALLRHTTTVLASRRCTAEHRRTVAREFVHRLHDPRSGPEGWAARVSRADRDRVTRLLRSGRATLRDL